MMSAHTASGTALLERPPGSPNCPWIALLDVTDAVREGLAPALQEAGFEVRTHAVIERGMLEADVVIMEADRGARMLSDMQALRGVLGRSCLIGVVGWWSEYESEALRTADALLHVPLRGGDLTAALTVIRTKASSLHPVGVR